MPLRRIGLGSFRKKAARLRPICVTLCLLLGTMPVAAQLPDSYTRRIQEGAQHFEARVDEAARTLESAPRLERLSPEQRKGMVEFVAGNMLFVIVHEMGHALISEMQLPVLGREEDAADAHAVVVLLKAGSTFTHRVLVGAATGWFASDKRNRAEGVKLAFYDEHGLDQQRAFQIVCLMVGSNPEKFKDLADQTKLPETRQGTCQGDYSNATWSWDKSLKPFLRTPEQPRSQIDVVYGEGKGALDVYARTFRAMRLLEIVGDVAADEYVWHRPISLEMQSCGIPDAHWSISTQKLTLCYEMAADFARLYRDYVATPAKGRTRKSK